MFPERLNLDDVANLNLYRAIEIKQLSLSEKNEYIVMLEEAIRELKAEIAYVESTIEEE